MCTPSMRPAGAFEHAHAYRLQLSPQLLLLVNRVDYVLRPVEQPGEIYSRRLALEAVVGELLCVAREPRRLREHAGRNTAVVGAGSAHVPALHKRYRRAQLAGAQGRRHPGWPPPTTTTSKLSLSRRIAPLTYCVVLRRPDPQRGVHRLHRLPHHRNHLVAQPVEVGLLA